VTDAAFESAARLLRHRDYACADLDRRLADRGFDEAERATAIATLTRTGVLDDGRFATDRARALAARGAGDRLIEHDLAGAGVPRELIEIAIDGLEPESKRARVVVARRGASPKTARYLAAKGYSEEAVRAAVAHSDDERLG
jgi:SOS response regulatory protein OraA/RecX